MKRLTKLSLVVGVLGVVGSLSANDVPYENIQTMTCSDDKKDYVININEKGDLTSNGGYFRQTTSNSSTFSYTNGRSVIEITKIEFVPTPFLNVKKNGEVIVAAICDITKSVEVQEEPEVDMASKLVFDQDTTYECFNIDGSEKLPTLFRHRTNYELKYDSGEYLYDSEGVYNRLYSNTLNYITVDGDVITKVTKNETVQRKCTIKG